SSRHRDKAGGKSSRSSELPSLLRLERLGAGGLARLVEGELLDLGLRLLQESVAMLLQCLAALVDVDALFQLHVAPLQTPDDAFELLQRLLERHVLDVEVL